jgi:hypothetical protein
MVCTRAALGQTITVTIPQGMVQMLDWIAANTKNSDGSQKYLYGLNVIWQDVIALLLPGWGEAFKNGQVAPLQAEIDAARAEIDAQLAAGQAGLTVVGP